MARQLRRGSGCTSDDTRTGGRDKACNAAVVCRGPAYCYSRSATFVGAGVAALGFGRTSAAVRTVVGFGATTNPKAAGDKRNCSHAHRFALVLHVRLPLHQKR